MWPVSEKAFRSAARCFSLLVLVTETAKAKPWLLPGPTLFGGQCPGWAGLCGWRFPPAPLSWPPRAQTRPTGAPGGSEVPSARFPASLWPHTCRARVTRVSVCFCLSKGCEVFAQFYPRERRVLVLEGQ